MPNTLTDQLDLVSTASVTGGNFIFPPSVRPDEGFSLHVFSPSGEWLGVVNEHDGRFKARNGDTVIRVNLGPRSYTFKGTLTTADGYARPYTATVVLRVKRARQFATLYRQGSDPIELTRLAIHGHLARWTQRLEHEDITQENVRYHLERGAGFAESDTGVGVERVEEAVAYASEHHVKMRGIVEQDVLDRMNHGIDSRKHDEQLAESKKDEQAAREKVDGDALTNDRIAGRSTIFATLVEAQRKQLNDWFVAGYSLADMQQQNPQLFTSLDQMFSNSTRKQALPAASDPSSGDTSSSIFSGPRPSQQSSRPVDAEGLPYDKALGAKHRHAVLTHAHWDLFDDRGVRVLLAYELVHLDAGGPAESAGLLPGDCIIQVGSLALTEERTLEICWSAVPAGGAAHIQFVRGMTIQATDVAIIQ